MNARLTTLLVPAMLLAAACGTGRIVPNDTAAPSSEPVSSGPVAAPAPAAAPTPQAVQPPATQPSASGSAGYSAYGDGAVELRRVGQFVQTSLTTPERLVI